MALLLIPAAMGLIAGATGVAVVDRTFLEATFWTGRLEAIDAYERTLTEILPAAVTEISEPAPGGAEFDFTRVEDDIVRVAREVVPPKWVEDGVAGALEGLLPYASGETDTLEVAIPIRDRIEAAAAALKREAQNPSVYLPLYDEGVSWGATRIVQSTAGSEVAIDLTEDEAASFLRRIVPAEWLQASIGETVDAALPYLVNEVDGFAVTIDLEERIDSLAEVMKEVFAKADTDRLIVDEIVMPAVAENLDNRVAVVDGVGFTSVEILEAVRDTLTPDWLAEIRGSSIDRVADYTTGRADSLQVTIELGDRTAWVVDALAPRVEEALAAEYAALPVCVLEEETGMGQGLPMCRQPGVRYEEFISGRELDPVAAVASALGPLVPDELVIDDARFRGVIGPIASELLDDVRAWSQEGFTVSHETLLENFDLEDREWFNDIRVAGALTLVDEKDIERYVVGEEAPTADGERSPIRIGPWVTRLDWIAAALVLVIGGLAGRNWGSRLVWTCVPLVMGAGVVWVLASPVYDAIGPSLWESALDEALIGSESAVAQLGTELWVEFLRAVTNEFAAGLAGTSITLLTLGCGGLVVGTILHVILRGRRRPEAGRPGRGPVVASRQRSGGTPFG